MSLTQAENAFGSVHEDGLNDIFRAFFTARPRYINYGTPFFVPVTTVAATQIPFIAFPFVPSGLQLAISFGIPVVDIVPGGAGSAPLPPGANQFTLRTDVALRILCGGRDANGENQTGKILESKLSVFVRCHPVLGGGAISIAVDQVEIVDILPDSLETVLECLLLTILRGVFANLNLPLTTLTAGAFGLTLAVGPLAETDQIKIRGNVI